MESFSLSFFASLYNVNFDLFGFSVLRAIIYLNNQEKPDPTVLNRTRLTSINILRGPNTKRLLPSWNADFFFFFSLF